MRPWTLIGVLAFIVGLLGTLPHIWFSKEIGEWLLFEGAWDESFYLIALSSESTAWNEYPARSAMRLLLHMAGGSNPRFAMVADFVWPALVVMAAGTLATALLRPLPNPLAWTIPITFILVFSSDLFAFNSSAVFPPELILSFKLSRLPIEWRQLIPDSFTPFLYIYRTPEPQLSLAFYLFYFAIVVRFLRLDAISIREWLVLGIGTAVCTTIYVFFATAILMTAGSLLLALLITRKWSVAGGVAAILFGCTALFLWLLVQTHASEASAMLFSSRIPMISPSVVYGVILSVWFAWMFRRHLPHDTQLVFGLLCLFTPIATLNQQVLTGVMLQTLNWERYVNYTFVIVGLILIVSRSRCYGTSAILLPRAMRGTIRIATDRLHLFGISRGTIAVLSVIAVTYFVYSAQRSTYRQFLDHNLRIATYVKSLDKVAAELPLPPQSVTLDDPAIDAQVRLRTKVSGLQFNAYTDLVSALKNPAQSAHLAGTPETLTIQQKWGFMHAMRLGFSREAYEAELLAEIDRRTCWPHLMFHFSFLECAPYVSDFRMYVPEHLQAEVSKIGARYEIFQKSSMPRNDAIILTSRPIPEAEDAFPAPRHIVIKSKLITKSGHSSPAEVIAYWYHPPPPK